MSGNTKTRILIISIILLVMLCLATGYYAFLLREKYNIINTNEYTEAFSNLVNYVNNVEYYLHFFSKTPIINGVRLLSSDRYILKSSDRLYLTAKEEE